MRTIFIYLGLYLGNQPWSQTVSYNNKSGELTVGMATNPAIYVFDLQPLSGATGATVR